MWFICMLKTEKPSSRLGLLRETRRFLAPLFYTFWTRLTSQKYGRTSTSRGDPKPPASWKDGSLTRVQCRTYNQPLTYLAIYSDVGSIPLSLYRNLLVVSAGSSISVDCSSATQYTSTWITWHWRLSNMPTRYMGCSVLDSIGEMGVKELLHMPSCIVEIEKKFP